MGRIASSCCLSHCEILLLFVTLSAQEVYHIVPLYMYHHIKPLRSFQLIFSSSNDEDDNGREPIYTEDGEYESVTSSENEKGKSIDIL